MTGTLAKVDIEELDVPGAVRQLDQIREFISREFSPEIVAEAISRARLAREWAKIKRVSEEVARQASMLELAAWRRLGQLGEDGLAQLAAAHKATTTRNRKAALELASLPDGEFQRLMDEAQLPMSAVAFVSHIEGVRERDRRIQLGREIAAEELRGDVSDKTALALLERHEKDVAVQREVDRFGSEEAYRRDVAARMSEIELRQEKRERGNRIEEMLKDLYVQGDPFSVSEVVDRMIDADFELAGDPRGGDYVTRTGYADLIRHILNSAVADDRANEAAVASIAPPRFVTFEDPEVGWVRIPWAAATLGQFRAMCAMRRSQANDLSNKADELEEVLRLIEIRAEKHPAANLHDLWRFAAMSLRMTGKGR